MARPEEIYAALAQAAPVELAEKWDNVGLLVNTGMEVTSIMVALDITDEVVPFIRETVCRMNAWSDCPGPITFGCSLGATHAVNLFLRRPDLFSGMLALSGIYTAEYGFGSYMDGIVYENSPVHFLPNMAPDHHYVEMYNQRRGVICVGQGAWEQPETTRVIKEQFDRLGVNLWVDFWGFDVNHDWDWWYKQVPYFMPYLLGE